MDDAINALKDKYGYVDFNCIVPVETDADDIYMNDYINDCLNLWISRHREVNKENFISTMKFVGLTREYVYKFKKLNDEELNMVRSQNRGFAMLSNADIIISSVKKKSIFNGFFARESSWGTGTQPINQKVKGNRIDFITFNTPALKVFEKLSSMFPQIQIVYTYVYEHKDEKNKVIKDINIVTFKNGECDVVRQDFKEEVNTFNLIKQNVSI